MKNTYFIKVYLSFMIMTSIVGGCTEEKEVPKPSLEQQITATKQGLNEDIVLKLDNNTSVAYNNLIKVLVNVKSSVSIDSIVVYKGIANSATNTPVFASVPFARHVKLASDFSFTVLDTISVSDLGKAFGYKIYSFNNAGEVASNVFTYTVPNTKPLLIFPASLPKSEERFTGGPSILTFPVVIASTANTVPITSIELLEGSNVVEKRDILATPGDTLKFNFDLPTDQAKTYTFKVTDKAGQSVTKDYKLLQSPWNIEYKNITISLNEGYDLINNLSSTELSKSDIFMLHAGELTTGTNTQFALYSLAGYGPKNSLNYANANPSTIASEFNKVQKVYTATPIKKNDVIVAKTSDGKFVILLITDVSSNSLSFYYKKV